jgi:CRISPR/Cas system-associated endonuclease Cas1
MKRGEVVWGVQAHVLVLRRDLEQREDDQDEDEVNLLIRISNQLIYKVNLTKLMSLMSG